MEEPRVSVAIPVEKPGPSGQQSTLHMVTRHGTEVFYGLITPGNSPTKAPGDQVRFHVARITPHLPLRTSQQISTVIEREVEMDDTFTGDRDPPASPSPGSGSGLPAPLETEPQSDIVSALNERIANLEREKAALQGKEEYVIRKLSRNGQGTLSNIETVTDRTVRQRDELRVENQELRAFIGHLESGIVNLQGQIVHMQDKLDRAEGERFEMEQGRRRWITRMWALTGRIPGELRKRDAEIENMRKKLADMHARLAQQQSRLRELQGQLEEEKVKRVGVEAELDGSRLAHAQEIKDRDLAGQRLRDQLKQVVNSLDSGAISI